jgi:hypothetical protein
MSYHAAGRSSWACACPKGIEILDTDTIRRALGHHRFSTATSQEPRPCGWWDARASRHPSRLTRREATAGRWERVATSGLGSLHLAGGLSQPIAAPDRGGLGTTADRQSGRVYGREDRGEPPQASCGPEAPHHPLPLAQQHMRIRNPWHDLPPATPEPRRVFRRRIGVDTTC